MNFRGRGDYFLYDKLKSIKDKLKDRNIDVFTWINLKISNNIDDQYKFDQMLIDNIRGDVTKTMNHKRLNTENLWKQLELRESMLRIKFGQRWLK